MSGEPQRESFAADGHAALERILEGDVRHAAENEAS